MRGAGARADPARGPAAPAAGAAREYADGRWPWRRRSSSGVRLAFRSSHVHPGGDRAKQVYVGAPPRPDGVYDLVVDPGGRAGNRDRRRPPDDRPGHRDGRRRAGRRPCSSSADLRATTRRSRSGCRGTSGPSLVALLTDAPVERPRDRGRPGARRVDQPRFQRQQPHVHVAGRRGVPRRVDLVNLGFGGSACSTPSSHASSATPAQTSSASSSGSTWSTPT